MSAPEVPCPVCEGGGEIAVRQDYYGNWDTESCYECKGEGEVPATSVDAEGELITFGGCECDMDDPCHDARCQMSRDLDERAAHAAYKRGELAPPNPWDLIDAGRGHLVRAADWGTEPF